MPSGRSDLSPVINLPAAFVQRLIFRQPDSSGIRRIGPKHSSRWDPKPAHTTSAIVSMQLQSMTTWAMRSITVLLSSCHCSGASSPEAVRARSCSKSCQPCRRENIAGVAPRVRLGESRQRPHDCFAIIGSRGVRQGHIVVRSRLTKFLSCFQKRGTLNQPVPEGCSRTVKMSVS